MAQVDANRSQVEAKEQDRCGQSQIEDPLDDERAGEVIERKGDVVGSHVAGEQAQRRVDLALKPPQVLERGLDLVRIEHLRTVDTNFTRESVSHVLVAELPLIPGRVLYVNDCEGWEDRTTSD